MRAITIGYTDKSYTLRVYFRSEPSESELELLNDITGEVCADIPEFTEFNEEAVVNNEDHVNRLDALDAWVYVEYYDPGPP